MAQGSSFSFYFASVVMQSDEWHSDFANFHPAGYDPDTLTDFTSLQVPRHHNACGLN
jgi:hypothetical protein